MCVHVRVWIGEPQVRGGDRSPPGSRTGHHEPPEDDRRHAHEPHAAGERGRGSDGGADIPEKES